MRCWQNWVPDHDSWLPVMVSLWMPESQPQQVGGVVLQLEEQEVKVLQRRRSCHREPKLDIGGAGREVALRGAELLCGRNGSVGEARHG